MHEVDTTVRGASSFVVFILELPTGARLGLRGGLYFCCLMTLVNGP